MNELPSWLYLIGPGGIATIAAAYFGWRSKSEHDKAEQDRERERNSNNPSVWTMQTLMTINGNVEEVRRAVDTNTKALSDLTLQVNHIAYVFEKKP